MGRLTHKSSVHNRSVSLKDLHHIMIEIRLLKRTPRHNQLHQSTTEKHATRARITILHVNMSATQVSSSTCIGMLADAMGQNEEAQRKLKQSDGPAGNIEQLFAKLRKQGNVNVTYVRTTGTELKGNILRNNLLMLIYI